MSKVFRSRQQDGAPAYRAWDLGNSEIVQLQHEQTPDFIVTW